jgi:hypothetical protein
MLNRCIKTRLSNSTSTECDTNTNLLSYGFKGVGVTLMCFSRHQTFGNNVGLLCVQVYLLCVHCIYRIHWHLCTRLGTNHITAEYCISLFLISEHQSPITKRFEFDSGADLLFRIQKLFCWQEHFMFQNRDYASPCTACKKKLTTCPSLKLRGAMEKISGKCRGPCRSNPQGQFFFTTRFR